MAFVFRAQKRENNYPTAETVGPGAYEAISTNVQNPKA